MSKLPLNYLVDSVLDPCTICLGTCENKSFPKGCLHGFCFTCLLQWSKVKPECPLCLKPFSSVIHNIRSNQEHDEFTIDPLWQEEAPSSEFSESAGEDSSWYTISSSSSTGHEISEQSNSYSEQDIMQAAINLWVEPWLESSSDESNNDTRSESSWITVNTDSDSEDDISTLHSSLRLFDIILQPQSVLSLESVGGLD